MRTTQVPHRQASTSRHVSDQAFPELSNFLRVTLRACGGRPGNEAITGALHKIHVQYMYGPITRAFGPRSHGSLVSLRLPLGRGGQLALTMSRGATAVLLRLPWGSGGPMSRVYETWHNGSVTEAAVGPRRPH